MGILGRFLTRTPIIQGRGLSEPLLDLKTANLGVLGPFLVKLGPPGPILLKNDNFGGFWSFFKHKIGSNRVGLGSGDNFLACDRHSKHNSTRNCAPTELKKQFGRPPIDGCPGLVVDVIAEPIWGRFQTTQFLTVQA